MKQARAPEQGSRSQPASPNSISFFGWRAKISDAVSSSPDLWDVALVCVTACLSLGIVQFVGSDTTFAQYFPPTAGDSYWMLRYKTWWVGWIVVSFLILPAILMAVMPGNRLRDCNLSFSGFRQHFWIYVGLFVAVLPVIWLVSLSPAFYDFYPMYPQAGRSWFDLMAWESLYAAQFIAVEFFFRGFLVGGLARHIGILSVPVSVMPYMMLHFAKPWPEASASVAAGLVLGFLGVEAQVHLGRRLCALCGRVHHGPARPQPQIPTPLAAPLATLKCV